MLFIVYSSNMYLKAQLVSFTETVFLAAKLIIQSELLLCVPKVGHRRDWPAVCSVAGKGPHIHTPGYEDLNIQTHRWAVFISWLQYDTRSRLSSETALRHPYFLSLGDNIHNLADSKTHTHWERESWILIYRVYQSIPKHECWWCFVLS